MLKLNVYIFALLCCFVFFEIKADTTNLLASKIENKVNQQVIPVVHTDSSFKVNLISVEINEIYHHDDKIWFQDFANKLHIKTKEHVILNLLSFKVGDSVTVQDLAEAERLLRTQHYIHNVKITNLLDGIIIVSVTDTWSLFPTFSFSHTANKSNTAIGIRDSNLLGLGIETTLKYRFDPDRKGYRLRVSTPVNYIEHSSASVIFEEYDIGQIRGFSFEKPFYTNDTSSMFGFNSVFENIESIIYQNNSTLGTINSKTSRLNFDYGWLESKEKNTGVRQLIGIISTNREILEISIPEYQDSLLSRDQILLWWGKEYFEDDYDIFTNINLMTTNEDINLGSKIDFKIGLGSTTFSDLQSEATVMGAFGYTGGTKFGDLLFLQDFKLTSESYENAKSFYSLDYHGNLYYPLTEKILFYAGNQFAYVNQYRDQPQSLGGESGMRGYPIQYQHGKKRWLSNFELRYYPETDLWHSFTFGWAAFYDVGRAWDHIAGLENVFQNRLSSVGFGLRIFPKVASGTNVIHLDLVKPLADDPELSNWEWRVEVKSSF